MVNISKGSIGIVKGTPNPDVNATKILKVLEAKDSKKCPSCKAPHKCSDGYWCRKDQNFHQCTSNKCPGGLKNLAGGNISGGAMWRVVTPEDEDSE